MVGHEATRGELATCNERVRVPSVSALSMCMATCHSRYSHYLCTRGATWCAAPVTGRCQRMACREATTEELAACHRRDLMSAVAALSARVAAEQAAAAAATAAGTHPGSSSPPGPVSANGAGNGSAAMPGMVRPRVSASGYPALP